MASCGAPLSSLAKEGESSTDEFERIADEFLKSVGYEEQAPSDSERKRAVNFPPVASREASCGGIAGDSNELRALYDKEFEVLQGYRELYRKQAVSDTINTAYGFRTHRDQFIGFVMLFQAKCDMLRMHTNKIACAKGLASVDKARPYYGQFPAHVFNVVEVLWDIKEDLNPAETRMLSTWLNIPQQTLKYMFIARKFMMRNIDAAQMLLARNNEEIRQAVELSNNDKSRRWLQDPRFRPVVDVEMD